MSDVENAVVEDEIYSERLERLLEGRKKKETGSNQLGGKRMTWQDIVLPEDFEALLDMLAVCKEKQSVPMLINILLEDIEQIVSLDYDKKICSNGCLRTMEITCKPGEISSLEEYIPHMKNCCAACVYVKGDISLVDIREVVAMIQDHMNLGGEIYFSGKYDESLEESMLVQAVFRFRNQENGSVC